jgi:hypothetical protein
MQLLSVISLTLLLATAEQSGGEDDDLQGAKACASQDAILAERALRNRTVGVELASGLESLSLASLADVRAPCPRGWLSQVPASVSS